MIDFDCVCAEDVRVFRLPRETQDSQDKVRLRAEISIRSCKTGGHRIFTPKILGYRYPRLMSNGSTNWAPDVTIALTILCIMAGTVNANEVFESKFEPLIGNENNLTRFNEKNR